MWVHPSQSTFYYHTNRHHLIFTVCTEFLRAYLKSLFVDKKQVASHAQCLIVSHRLRAPLPVAILFLLSRSSPEPVCGFWKVKADNRQVATLAVVTGWGHSGSIKPGPGHWSLHWPGNPGLAENLEWCCHPSSEYPVKWTVCISRHSSEIENVYWRQICSIIF